MELAVHLFLSLDGVYTSPGAPDETPGRYFEKGGWVIPFGDDEFGAIVDGWFAATDALLLGRVTYEIFAGFWPQVTDPDNAVAARLNGARKYVASRTLTAPEWANTTVLDGDALAGVRRLREAPGGELQVHGSGALARSLHVAGLVDVYRLIIAPVVLGSGERLFEPGCPPSGFEVVTQRTTSQGLTYLELRPAHLRQAVPTIEDGREVVHAL
ncbi:dihydrofolate reductase family protein [Spongisporangium articulatum]|uniref:Dihydrofolate reductase family protein n=1 Tax=Spongisporangium articulatum TaxID=3362603 RepID=A0ABW8AKF5_9ACTN